jgi:hypothetical protein
MLKKSNRIINSIQILFLAFFFILLFGCSVSPSLENKSLDYLARTETQVNENVRVSAVVLSPEESQKSFGYPLANKSIQPLWMEIENKEDTELYLMLLSLDADYFSPSEVAWKFRSSQDEEQNDRKSTAETKSLDEMIEMFMQRHIPVIVPPRTTVSGYVYTNLDSDTKVFTVDLFGEKESRSFDFVQLVPGFLADYMTVDFNKLYMPNEIRDLDLKGLRGYLESLPCCVLGGDKKTAGDPLNLVLIGEGADVLATLVHQGWNLTETISSNTMWRTVASSVFGSKYSTSPVSPLYLFDRPQDIALQKARETVDERNHLRLWRAPVTYKGKKVFVGQISRDIGLKFSSKTFVTHKIDPVVDEARLYITLDMIASQNIKALGYVKGVGFSESDKPQYNYTEDPYYTDGNRVVLFFSDERVLVEDIQYLPWEQVSEMK